MFNVDQNTVDLENEGVWTDYKGSKFLIASSGSTKFQRLFTRLQMPYRKDIDKRRLDPETQLDIMCKAMSKAMLLDWKDVVDNSGNPVPFDKDVAYKALKGNSDFREFVSNFATEIENYVQEEREELGKSVEKSSDGEQSSGQEKTS
jgi:hypothetical protein